jgi:hypothetical protein
MQGRTDNGKARTKAGPSTAAAKSAAFAQEDTSRTVAKKNKQQQKQNAGVSPLRCASVEMTASWSALRSK